MHNVTSPFSSEIERIPMMIVTAEQTGQQCTICLSDFKVGEPVIKTACKHFFHRNCLIFWLRVHSNW